MSILTIMQCFLVDEENRWGFATDGLSKLLPASAAGSHQHLFAGTGAGIGGSIKHRDTEAQLLGLQTKKGMGKGKVGKKVSPE
jgi:hypothetical protein